MQGLSNEQKLFLIWLYHNYSWLEKKGYHPNTIAFQSVVLRILRDGEYGKMDREMITDCIKFINGMGLTTYHSKWRWYEDTPELDYLVNIKT